MRAKELIVEGTFNWTDYDGMDMKDRLNLVETIFTSNRNLFESNDPNYSDYFLSLRGLSDAVVKNKLYIVSLLALVNNQIMPLQPTFIGKVLEKIGDQYKIELPDGRISLFPDKHHSDKMLVSTFFFKTKEKFNKFRTSITMKFTKDLPEIKENEGVV